MLNALKQQLVRLSKDRKDTFDQSLKKKAGAKEAKFYAEPLRNFVLVMPEMIAQVRAWTEQDELPAEVKTLHGHLLTYLYHPVDFLHDEGYGLFGYLDDAYVVGSVYRTTLNKIDPAKLRHLPNQEDITAQLEGWLDKTRKVIPKETAQIDRMLSELTTGKTAAMEKLLARPNPL